MDRDLELASDTCFGFLLSSISALPKDGPCSLIANSGLCLLSKSKQALEWVELGHSVRIRHSDMLCRIRVKKWGEEQEEGKGQQKLSLLQLIGLWEAE